MKRVLLILLLCKSIASFVLLQHRSCFKSSMLGSRFFKSENDRHDEQQLKTDVKFLKEIFTENKNMLTEMRRETNNRFDKLESRVNNRFDKLESRVNNRFDKLESRVEAKFDRVDDKIDKIAVQIEKMNEAFNTFARISGIVAFALTALCISALGGDKLVPFLIETLKNLFTK